jgi:hypothetical protein
MANGNTVDKEIDFPVSGIEFDAEGNLWLKLPIEE